MKTHWAAALATAGALLVLAAAGQSQAIRALNTGPISAAQDAAGRVWIARGVRLPGEGALPPGLYRWGNGGLRPAPLAPRGLQAVGIWPVDGGVAVAAWEMKTGPSLWWYRNGQRVALGELGQTCIQVQRVFGSGKAIYAVCTHAGSASGPGDARTRTFSLNTRIYRVAAGMAPRVALEIGPGSVFLSTRVARVTPRALPLRAVRAGRDAIWLWAGVPAIAPRLQILRGFVIVQGGSIHYQAEIPGLPQLPLEAVGRWDPRHLAAAVLGSGIYLIDTQHLHARRLTPPAAGNFRWVQKIFQAHGADYLIATTPGRVLRLTAGHRLRDVLWRVRRGRWTKLIAGLDDLSRPLRTPHRPALVTREGMWLGTLASGIWWVPWRGAPRLFDWREGFPLSEVRGLFALPAGKILTLGNATLGRARRMAAFVPAAMLGRPTRPSVLGRLRTVNPIRRFGQDAHGNVWGLLGAREPALAEWTGRGWRRFPLPAGIHARQVTGLDADQNGRIWLFPGCILNWPMAVFDPADVQWTVYAGYRAALQTVPRPVRMLDPAADKMRPIYGPGGQMAFQGACSGLNFFDGNAWHLWNTNDWPGPPHPQLAGAPFFDAAGHIALDLSHQTWEWQPGPGWHRTAYQPPESPAYQPLQPARPSSTPNGCGSPAAVSLVRGPWGREWWTTAAGDLYMGLPHSGGPGPPCREILGASQPQPFIDGRWLRQAFTGRHGDVFLLTRNGPIGRYVILFPPEPPPTIQARVTFNSGGEAQVHFSSSQPRGAQFIWRLDGGPWSRPAMATELALKDLIPGRHRLTAQTFNRRLEAAGTPARVAFTIPGRPGARLAQLLAELATAKTNAKRQAIVNELLEFPRATLLPALKRAEPAANATEQWWLKAAEQAAGG